MPTSTVINNLLRDTIALEVMSVILHRQPHQGATVRSLDSLLAALERTKDLWRISYVLADLALEVRDE